MKLTSQHFSANLSSPMSISDNSGYIMSFTLRVELNIVKRRLLKRGDVPSWA
jgi:hypothetical protein